MQQPRKIKACNGVIINGQKVYCRTTQSYNQRMSVPTLMVVYHTPDRVTTGDNG